MPATLFRRVLAVHLVVGLVAVGVMGLAMEQLLERQAVDALKQRLASEARRVRVTLAGESEATLQERVTALGEVSGSRITVIRGDGVVIADSEHEPRTMDNHASRPEVRVAFGGRLGTDQRTSSTLGRPFLYVAIPVDDGVVVRTALPAQEVTRQRGELRVVVLFLSLGVALIVTIVSRITVSRLTAPLERMAREARQIAAGGSATVSETGTRETRELADAINTMAANLAQVIDDFKAETHLRDEILASMDEGVLLADPSGELIYSNPAASELFGREVLRSLPPQLIGTGEKRFSVHHPSRRELRSTSVRLADGRILSVIQDETQQRRVDDLRTEFVANASHELKTPVAGILATAETLERAIVEDLESAPRFVSTLAGQARRLSQLVEDLLDLARLEQRDDAGAEVIDLSAQLRREADLIRPKADAKGLSLDVDAGTGIRVRGREEDLALMIRNLLENAVNYTNEGGVKVELQQTQTLGEVRITVQDTGKGIPRADLERIFERFYRVDKARSRETGGTGLGLSIVRHVAQSHGGHASVTSELGRGSTFCVTIPAAQS